MRLAPFGQKWVIDAIDKQDEKSGGITNNYEYLPKVIESMLLAGFSKIVIRDETIYKDVDDEPKTESNVYRLQGRR